MRAIIWLETVTENVKFILVFCKNRNYILHKKNISAALLIAVILLFNSIYKPIASGIIIIIDKALYRYRFYYYPYVPANVQFFENVPDRAVEETDRILFYFHAKQIKYWYWTFTIDVSSAFSADIRM
jgi:hypothetical protein